MNVMSQTGGAAAIHGHSFTLGPDHLLAIYERNGVAWVAEFHGSRGEFTYAGAWFRSDFGGLRYCHPGMFGIFALIEGVRQLRGECGARQVPNAQTGVVHGFGGVFAGNATVVLGSSA